MNSPHRVPPMKHRAIDLTTGRPTDTTVTLAPLVQAAMKDLNLLVNHANGLAGSHDEGLAIQTLTEPVRHGHRFVVEDLCAWAAANEFTGSEVGRMRRSRRIRATPRRERRAGCGGG
ncbi:hypothetical protein JNW88_00060 [Micromonospora sp. ATA32]|nr:hypothetical protein [Micromonospora sp. ATA32]